MEKRQKTEVRNVLLAVFITAIFLLTSAWAMALNASAAEERIFVVGGTESVSTANPFRGIYDADYMMYYYLYNYLTEYDDNGTPIPDLAQSWWYMDGQTAFASGSTKTDLLNRNASEWPVGSIWEYNLTEGVTWSDGAPFDADDVRYTIDLQTGVNYASFWAFQPYTKWIDHTQKVDQYKIRIFFTDRTNVSNPAIPIVWGTNIFIPILPKHVLKELSPITIAQTWDGVPTVGTGPFIGTEILGDEIIAKEKITLIKNPEWERGLGRISNLTCQVDKLVIKFYTEKQTLILDMKTKKLDGTEIAPIDYLSLLNTTDKPPELKVASQLSLSLYTKISHFNHQIGAPALGTLNPARTDKALHRATALATDRDYIVDEIFKGLGVKGVGLLTPVVTNWYYDAYSDTENTSWFNVTSASGALLYSYHDTIADVMDYNITRANDILNASGYDWPTYPNGYRIIGDVAADRLVAMGVVGNRAAAKVDSKGDMRYLKFEDLTGDKNTQDGEISQYLADAWKDIGVQMVPTPVNAAIWSKVVYGFQDEFTETYWSGDFDPNYLLYVPSSYSMDGWNEWGTPDPWYDQCYNNQAREFNETKRLYWVQECEKYLFLSGTASMTTCNPMSCFAYLDYRWTDWGNVTWNPGYMIYQISWVGEQNVPDTDSVAIIITGAIGSVILAAAAVVIVRRHRINKMLEEEGHHEKSEQRPDRPSGSAPDVAKLGLTSEGNPTAQKHEEIVVQYDEPKEGN